jgi:hypothetical protein
VAVATVRERAVGSLRDAGRRLSGRYARPRHGYFYVWSRAAVGALQRWARRDPGPAGPLAAVGLDDLSERVPGASYRQLEPPATELPPPPDWDWPATFPTRARRYHTPAHREGCGVLEIRGGVVFGYRGLLGADLDGVLTDASSLWNENTRSMLADAAAALAFGVVELDGVTMSAWAGNGGINYAHCLLQSIPRLDLLRRGFGLEADRYLVGSRAPGALFEALDLLGIPDERRLVVPRDGAPAYRCATLRAATSPPFAAEWPTRFLRELFLPDPPRSAPRRIYVRREGPLRKVLNEDEVIALLESRGFEILTMDGPVRGQAVTFAGAEAIVAAHGAALANLVFAPPGAAVVELMGRNTASVLYMQLAWRLGLRYEMVMGIEPAPSERWWTWQQHADTIVDVPALRRSLERLGLT